MTDMIRSIRQVTEEEGLKRGRPILLAAHVPETELLCKSIGLDVRTWLQEGLIDLLTTGRFIEFTIPMAEINKLAHQHNVPVYPMINSFFKGKDYVAGNDAAMFSDLAVWRGDALNMYAEGADGMYMFNVFNPNLKLWRELGDRDALLKQERAYIWDYLPSQGKSESVYPKLRLTRAKRAVEVTKGGSEVMPLYVGEDLSRPDAPGKKANWKLLVHVAGLTVAHQLVLTVNGRPLKDPEPSSPLGETPADVWLQYKVSSDAFQTGENRLQGRIARDGPGRPTVDKIRLEVTPVN
jgi:hypothetical protein